MSGDGCDKIWIRALLNVLLQSNTNEEHSVPPLSYFPFFLVIAVRICNPQQICPTYPDHPREVFFAGLPLKMADESTCVAVLRTFPCEPKDYNTARCRIAPRVMRAIGANIGSVISVNLSSFNVLCTAWPRDDGIEDAVQFDAFITQGIKSEEGRPIEKNLRHVKLRVPDDFRVLRTVEAEEVVLSIHVSSDSDEQELYQGPSVPKQLQEDRNERYMRAVLRNHTITLDCCIRPRKSRNESNGLLAEIEKIVVESTKPFSCECAVYGPETQPIPGEQQTAAFVRVTDKTKILVRSVKRYSDDTIPSYFSLAGVETAAKTLKELIEYPFLYPESFSYLGLECPKGVLLQGEPGVGKTLLVKTVTSECRAQLVTLNGTDVFGPHPGESEQNLRRAFEKARYLLVWSPGRYSHIFPI